MQISKFYILRPSIAIEIGEAEAAILEKIAVYCRGKASNLKGEEGKWIYNSVSSWKIQHFQHWSESKIYRALKSLEEQGLIRSKQASFRGRENIRWYTVEEKGYKILNDNIRKSNSVKNNCGSYEESYLDEFYISSYELEKDIEPTNYKSSQFINNSPCSKNYTTSNGQKKASTISVFQFENDSRQNDEGYNITEKGTEKTSSRRSEEEKYFELGKKKNREMGETLAEREDRGYEKEKGKIIRNLNDLIEEEVERRLRERRQEELEKEVAEEMERLYREYEKMHEEDGTKIQGGFNFSELFAALKKYSTIKEENKGLEAKAEEEVGGKDEVDVEVKKAEANSAISTSIITATQATKITSVVVSDIQEGNQSVTQTMVDLWNKVFEYSISPIKAYSNKRNEQILLNIYRTVFNRDLNNWREYTLKVNSSQFLMGEKDTKNNFKAVFGWLIKEKTIERILNGEYGVGDRELDINNISQNREIKKEEKVTEIEKKIANNLKENLNEFKEYEEFRNYIEEEGYQEDNDRYKLGLILRHIPKRDFLNKDEYKLMRDRLFESYLMKKHIKRSRLEIRDKIRDAVSKESKEIIFNKSREVQELGDYSQVNINNHELLMRDISKNQVNINNQLN
ncbi:helix-turn-helix transcriptional regulator [Candidatus Bandiella numerosa]|uniref:helix-turn-helix transcriptional regulator n=1 Tax=Candidatus Bandiella numerosa TaxID=2570586 RepID=UPI00249DEBBE|nr:helix-turn-helix transcriptional regulator [Candidatus Bandiella numerosa]WHA04585.1 helix-turn-helix transcriptional regulator [Candidatus Bandiella numerosa]